MIRSKLSIRVVLLVAGVGLSVAALAGSQPAAASGGHCKFSHRKAPVFFIGNDVRQIPLGRGAPDPHDGC